MKIGTATAKYLRDYEGKEELIFLSPWKAKQEPVGSSYKNLDFVNEEEFSNIWKNWTGENESVREEAGFSFVWNVVRGNHVLGSFHDL